MENYLLKSGYFQTVQVGEFSEPPTEKGSLDFAADIRMMNVSVATLTLNGTIESHVVLLRIWRSAFTKPASDVELGLAKVVQMVTEDLLGEYDLGATVRNIDAGGQYGTGLSTRFGNVDLSGVVYRIADITLPLVVDDSAVLAA